MSVGALIFFAAIVVGLVFLLSKRVVVPSSVKLEDIPAIFEKLKTVGKDGSFAVIIFTPPDKSSEKEAINIQFSIENGRVGLDWVFLGPANIRDKEKFHQLAQQRSYTVVEHETNNVKYLRVEEGGSLTQLCEASIRELYSISSDTELSLIPDGFKWP